MTGQIVFATATLLLLAMPLVALLARALGVESRLRQDHVARLLGEQDLG
ncbi:hypothetical protein ACTQ49_08785 [Luteococcus sp. Sow4_B9]